MRILVDGSITRVASPKQGFVAADLTVALLAWPAVRHLTLLNVDSTAVLAPLSTASLTGLKSLIVRQAPQAGASGMPALSSSVAATLRVIDISGCAGLCSIDFVCSCAQLRCLWMPGCVGVFDLSPLSACSETLEELRLARSCGAVSLAPLRACTRLRKLDFCGCSVQLHDQVEDLRQACTQLAPLSSVRLEGLVHEMQPSIPPNMQARAACALADMSYEGGPEVQDAIAAVCAIPDLVKLLGPESSTDIQAAAADVLFDLSMNHALNQVAIVTAGAIPALMRLLAPESSAAMQQAAAAVLSHLAQHAHNKSAIMWCHSVSR
ncbi:hypothetical protein FOA52_010441 [Chlamydomonas sp. UWO 241]|nr:hypothetical protein FOA52_010441 [Chlamydomonas sp. UWO 241]